MSKFFPANAYPGWYEMEGHTKWNLVKDGPPCTNPGCRCVVVKLRVPDAIIPATYCNGKYWYDCYDPDHPEYGLVHERLENVVAWTPVWAPEYDIKEE